MNATYATDPATVPLGTQRESTHSAVAWGAVFAGASVAAVSVVVLTMLGLGIGLGAASPYTGASATGFTIGAAVWLVVTQWLSSGLGGYLTGRLRTKWAALHTDEVFFRDTANGLVAWSVASLLAVGALSSALSGLLGQGGHAAAMAAAHSDGQSYMVDELLRPAQPGAVPPAPETRSEVSRILMHAPAGDMVDADRNYLAQLIAARAGVAQPEAAKRVDAVTAAQHDAAEKAKQAANVARKAGSAFMLYNVLAMLVGAFIAAAAAGWGGRDRDLK